MSVRIVQLVTRRQRRGGEVVAAELSTALAARRHDVRFAGLNAPPDAPLVPAGVVSDDVSTAPPSVLSPRAVVDLARYLRCVEPDVIQANGGYAMKYAVLAKRWSRRHWPLLYCNIGLSSDWLRRPGQRAWNRWLLRQADVTAAVSDASRADLLTTYGLDPDRVEVVRRGVPLEAEDTDAARSALRGELGLPAGASVLMHVGSFSPEKNHEGLLRIVEHVGRPDVHLVLVGDGPLRGDVERASANAPHVHVLGLRSDVPSLLAGADLLLLPSLTEGIPGVILEAGAQSLPTVAYDVGGVGEAVRDGVTGRLIPAGDEAGFAATIRSLLVDGTRRRELGRAARAFVACEYAQDRSVDCFERLYRRIALS